ncbi:putative transcriptional regulator [Gluconacetobacter diazotrophicus PA1 5]|uniref:Putative transcriptional regulator n=1 Tax=Gluconacetobacter diazotrophicus (strain ATCC 49037 / DSM 5601 / CCUG 37298 / CIP 103539 / LMG 7603 / PAl5) TaxID=272568 RepID=A9HLN3_GLUDA|nr:putative transcriptional regulator [Gluconacetobacter diazotrophicus PA1 5]
MNLPLKAELDRVFGLESCGDTPEDRAASSPRRFVRSQSQLSPDRPAATGPRMTARWALKQFGYAALREAVDEGATVISVSLDEPARSLREQRVRLGLTQEQVARASMLTVNDVRRAEQLGAISPVRRLQLLAQTLGLNDEQLGVRPDASADQQLAVRLRTLGSAGHNVRFSPSLVLKLAEAAWTISRQNLLAVELGVVPNILKHFDASDDYYAPVWRRGYDLAERTRTLLNLDPLAPIPSVRELIDQLGIPLIQAAMGAAFAGATVVNGDDRGIVINTEGDNQNVWVRRMTLCHELGHLLWDPPARLRRLHVDRYDDLRTAEAGGGDEVEARANAFAISFLAPREAVIEIVKRGASPTDQVIELMKRFGVGATAAKYHIANVSRNWGAEVDTRHVASNQLPPPDDYWTTNENWTADYFPVAGVPISRRGRFSGLVAIAASRELISTDTAASWLQAAPSALAQQLATIAELTAQDLAV